MARRFNRRKKEKKGIRRALNKSAHKKRAQRWKVYNAKQHVLNLSKYSLKDYEYIVLAKGLKFIPTPNNKHVRKSILQDFDEFARKLRCKYLFETGSNDDLHPFRTNTGYKPGPTCSSLENYIDKTRLELSSIEIKQHRNNLTTNEREALVSLKNNQQIVIKKADKSNTVVIMDREKYILEGSRQLNTKHYIEVDRSNLLEIQNNIENKVKEMYINNTLDKETFRYLKESKLQLQSGQLYLLPKIHKIKGTIMSALRNDLCSLKDLPPGRPIISQCNSPTYRIGAYCDHFLVPIIKKQLTYIKDTTDFIKKIESLHLPPNILLVTYDVTSMYTNMEFHELLLAVKDAYINSDKPEINMPYPDTSDLVDLIKIVLENNYFEFNGKCYKQIIGCAMGSTVSPEVSDIRMYQITQQIMTQFKHANKVIFHGRYRDDGFLIFNGSDLEIQDFFQIGNSCHAHLKFTFEISHTSANFLDTTVYKGRKFREQNKLDIRSYIKPTNDFLYLHRDSAHSNSVFKGFIKGECIRHLRNTNNKTELTGILFDFKNHLIVRGYSEQEIDPIIEETLKTDRKSALQEINSKRKTKRPLVMVTKYDPSIRGIKRRILKYWNDMKSDPKCNSLFATDPIIAYSKHKNIGDMIVRAKLQT